MKKVADLLKKRRALEKQIGAALSKTIAKPAALTAGVITVRSTDVVTAQMVKNGTVYTFALNTVALPFAQNGFYPLRPTAGQTNGLQWTVFQSKDTWAYQVNLIVNGMVMVLDRASSAQTPPVTLPLIRQQLIQVV
jgi:hypothetical protein